MPDRVLFLMLDGLGDRPSRELGLMTPLQAARKVALDLIASEGMTGLLDPYAPGVPVGSDTGHLSILGYDPKVYYTGRGPLEALGAGIDLKPGDVAFRVNMATVDDDWNLLDRRAGRISTGEARELARAVAELAERFDSTLSFEFHSTVEHRGVLVIRGEKASSSVTDVDPHREGVRVQMPRPTDGSESARVTAQELTRFLLRAKEVLDRHPLNVARRQRGLNPANALLPRGAGVMPKLPSLRERYGVRSVVIAGGALYRGVCRAAGMDVRLVPTATGTLNTDLRAKFEAAVESLRSYELVFLHIKGTDTASHDLNPSAKRDFIERIDRELHRHLDSILSGSVICVTGDHTTSSLDGRHHGDPVPLAVAGEGVRRDDVAKFDELSCSRGSVGRVRGLDLMNVLMDLIGRVEMYGE
ncbi:MAG: 2,3-bisphosphoglycerate-independent phosphoglycerate mutase [Thaumarchaeota archaeon]|nr:2,3-bisphosphoglycerate-independent phosphoglycerate mutase [Candidatus Calditenuaceae archaeon]